MQLYQTKQRCTATVLKVTNAFLALYVTHCWPEQTNRDLSRLHRSWPTGLPPLLVNAAKPNRQWHKGFNLACLVDFLSSFRKNSSESYHGASTTFKTRACCWQVSDHWPAFNIKISTWDSESPCNTGTTWACLLLLGGYTGAGLVLFGLCWHANGQVQSGLWSTLL